MADDRKRSRGTTTYSTAEIPLGDRDALLRLLRTFMGSTDAFALNKDLYRPLLNRTARITGSFDGYAKWLTTEELGILATFIDTVFRKTSVESRHVFYGGMLKMQTEITTPALRPLLTRTRQYYGEDTTGFLLLLNVHRVDGLYNYYGTRTLSPLSEINRELLELLEFRMIASEMDRLLSATNTSDITTVFSEKISLLSEKVLVETRVEREFYRMRYVFQRTDNQQHGILEYKEETDEFAMENIPPWSVSVQRNLDSTPGAFSSLRENALLVSFKVPDLFSKIRIIYTPLAASRISYSKKTFSVLRAIAALLCAYHLHVAPTEVNMEEVSTSNYIRINSRATDKREYLYYYSPLLRKWRQLPTAGETVILDWNLLPVQALTEDSLYSSPEPPLSSSGGGSGPLESGFEKLTQIAYRRIVKLKYDATLINSRKSSALQKVHLLPPPHQNSYVEKVQKLSDKMDPTTEAPKRVEKAIIDAIIINTNIDKLRRLVSSPEEANMVLHSSKYAGHNLLSLCMVRLSNHDTVAEVKTIREMLQFLLVAGADPKVPSGVGTSIYSPLLRLAELYVRISPRVKHDFFGMMQLLLDYGADVYARGPNKETLFYFMESLTTSGSITSYFRGEDKGVPLEDTFPSYYQAVREAYPFDGIPAGRNKFVKDYFNSAHFSESSKKPAKREPSSSSGSSRFFGSSLSSADDGREAGLGAAMRLITGALLGPNPETAPMVAQKMFSQWTPEHIASSIKALSCWKQLGEMVSTSRDTATLSELPSVTILQPRDEEPLNEYEQEQVKKTIMHYLDQVSSSVGAKEPSDAAYKAGYQLADVLHGVIEPAHVASSLNAHSARYMSERALPHYSRELVGVSMRGLKKSFSKTKRQARSSFSKNVLRRTPTDLKRTKALPFKLLSSGDRTFTRDGSVQTPKVGSRSKHGGSGYFRMEFRNNAAIILSIQSNGTGTQNGIEFNPQIWFRDDDGYPRVFFSKRDGSGNRYPIGDLYEFNFTGTQASITSSTGVLLTVQTQFGTTDTESSQAYYSEEISATLVLKPSSSSSSSKVQIYRVTDTDSLAFIDLHLAPRRNTSSSSSMDRYEFQLVKLRFFFPYKDSLAKINAFL